MKDIKESWRELIEEGETTVFANVYERFNLMLPSLLMGVIRRRRVKRTSFFGKLLYATLNIFQKIISVTSPYASDIFWLRVEAAWVVSDYKYKPTKNFGMSYTYYRKKHLSEKVVRMLLGKLRVSQSQQTYNNTLKFVTALRASTGHKNAAHFYAA